MNEDEVEKKGLKQTGSADDMKLSDTQPTLSAGMPSIRRRSTVLGGYVGGGTVVAIKPTAKVARAFIIWPLVIYSLIQINAYLLANNNNQYHTSSCFDALEQNQQPQTGSRPSATSQQQSSANLNCQTSSSSSSTPPCSSKAKVFQQVNDESLLKSLSSAYLSLLQLLNQEQRITTTTNTFIPNNSNRRSLFGGNILLAEAISVQYQAHLDKEIIVLNSSNFNSELIQHKHPFPHIKLIEYYVSFCQFCAKFRATYSELAREIHPWRNVIRLSAIDFTVPSNSPIAHSWKVDTVPTLRIHPPPSPSLARILNEQLQLWTSTLPPSELQKETSRQYSSSSLMVRTLNDVTQYMGNVQLLKSDLLRYIESYVHETKELPISWPDLKFVKEESLRELRSTHPRQELFLIIDASVTDPSSSSSSVAEPSLAFNMMMELSSSSAWKAIRYVRPSENKALIEDVIEQFKEKGELDRYLDTERMDLLNNLISSQPINNGNKFLLVHVHDWFPPIQVKQKPPLVYPFMSLLTFADLLSMENSSLSNGQQGSFNNRAKRSTDQDSSLSKSLSNQRLVELVANFVNRSYTETSIDKEFTEALISFDEGGKPDDSSKYFNRLSEEARRVQPPRLKKADFDNQVSDQIPSNDSTLLGKIRVFWRDLIYPPTGEPKSTTASPPSGKWYDVYFKYIVVTCICCLILIVVLRCTTYYVEMQRRRKTVMLNGNGNGTRYSLELQ